MWEQIKALWASSRVFQVTVVAAAIAGAIVVLRSTPNAASNPFAAAPATNPIDDIMSKRLPGGGTAAKATGAIDATADAVKQTATTVTKGSKVVEAGVDVAAQGLEAVKNVMGGLTKPAQPTDPANDVPQPGTP